MFSSRVSIVNRTLEEAANHVLERNTLADCCSAGGEPSVSTPQSFRSVARAPQAFSLALFRAVHAISFGGVFRLCIRKTLDTGATETLAVLRDNNLIIFGVRFPWVHLLLHSATITLARHEGRWSTAPMI